MQLIQIVTLLATVLTAGWLAAFFTQLLKREQWPSWVKLVLALVVSALVGLATAWLSGDVTRFVTLWKSGGITADQVLVLATLIFASAQTWYKIVWPGDKWVETVGNVGTKKV
jgi:hypothetical protein